MTNPNIWASSVAQRLRMIQSNWADEDSSTRRDYLREEVAHSLEGLPSSERSACLAALRRHFPEGTGGSAPAPAAAPAEPAAMSASQACEALLRLLKEAPDEEKDRICQRLRAGGLAIAAGGEAGGEELGDLAPEMIRRLRLKPGATINSSRALKLLMHLLESVLGVDDLVWNLWRQISPNSSVKRKGRADLRHLVGSYLTNDQSVSFSDVSDSMELSRKVNTSLLGALGPLGRNFAKRFAQKYSPDAIRETVDLEGGGGFLKAKAVQCWQKYEELARDLDEQALTLQMQEILSTYAEELILGPKAWQQTRNPFR